MKTVVLVLHLEVPNTNVDSFDIEGMFKNELVTWSVFEPLEDNAPIKINITGNGFEEI